MADSHQMFTDGFCELLKKKLANFNVATPCYSTSQAKEKLLREKYDFLFTDIIPHSNESKLFIEHCRRKYKHMLIIAVSGVTNALDVKDFLNSGVDAYLAKSAGSIELQIAIEKAMQGQKYISSELAGKITTALYAKSINRLSNKELEVLRLVAKGLTIIEAAEEMHLSQHTIINHRRSIMQKLGIHSATEMVKYAFENNLN